MFLAHRLALLSGIKQDLRSHPHLARLLWQWLALGLLVLAAFPEARGLSAWLGSGLFWWLVAPLAALASFHRNALTAAWRGFLVPASGRRRLRGAREQARRTGPSARPARVRLGKAA